MALLNKWSRCGKRPELSFFLCCEKADLDGTVFLVSPKKFKSSVFVLFMPKQSVAFTVSEKEQALCLDIRVLDEQGNEIELKDDDDDDDVVYSSDTDNEVVVGSTDEVLDAGFVIDEDSPESILDVFGDAEESDTDSYED